MRSLFMDRLMKHYRFQGLQRAALETFIQASRLRPLDALLFSIDKMDQQKSIFPYSWSQRRSSTFKQGARIVTSIIGVLLYALSKGALIYTAFEDMQQGSSFQSSLFIDILLLIAGSLGDLPKTLQINADNTHKETKNTIVLFFCVWLLANLDDTRLTTIELLFLMVGHTHGPVDGFFADLNKALLGQSYGTVKDKTRRIITK
jgi:hypothetical protein